MPTIRLLVLTPALISAALLGCAAPRAHDNFKTIMGGQVGRNSDDSDIERNRYPNLRVATSTLANGDLEEEFKSGRGLVCRVFFQIDPRAKRVVAWRYTGSEDDCAIVP